MNPMTRTVIAAAALGVIGIAWYAKRAYKQKRLDAAVATGRVTS